MAISYAWLIYTRVQLYTSGNEAPCLLPDNKVLIAMDKKDPGLGERRGIYISE